MAVAGAQTLGARDITPEAAAGLLADMADDIRPPDPTIVTAYREAMHTGDWHTGVITLDPEGRLLDGRHRLTAVVQHGRPVKFQVAVAPRPLPAVSPDERDAVVELCETRGGAAVHPELTGHLWSWLPDVDHPMVPEVATHSELPSATVTWWEPGSDDPGADELSLTGDECDVLRSLAHPDWSVPEPGNREVWNITKALDDGLTGKLTEIADVANEAWWRVEGLSCWVVRLFRYPPGARSDRHHDCRPSVMRLKLALIAQLSDPGDYEGGDLRAHLWGDTINIPATQGTVAALPGWTEHDVTPVTNGERWSLVVWMFGPALR